VVGVKTRCEGFFTASVNGKVQTVSRDTAVQKQLQNLPWSTGVREIASVRASRVQQDKDRVARAAAEEAAQLQAIEDAKLQAERLAQETKAAEQRELQDKIAALKVKIAEEKAQAAQERNWVLKQIDKLKGGTPVNNQEDAKPAAAAGTVAPPTSAASAKPPVSPPAASNAPTSSATTLEPVPSAAAPVAGAAPSAQTPQ
jgi:septal ring factor EnvC (AmiA/AmiB activator)